MADAAFWGGFYGTEDPDEILDTAQCVMIWWLLQAQHLCGVRYDYQSRKYEREGQRICRSLQPSPPAPSVAQSVPSACPLKSILADIVTKANATRDATPDHLAEGW